MKESLQISLFEQKIPVDKNFNFSTNIYSGQSAFKIDLEKSFEERPENIMDVFNFATKRYYDSPIVNLPFSQIDYCSFLGKSLQKFRHDNILEETDKLNRWNNKLERLLYKMLNRNIVRTSTFEVPSNTTKKKIETNERLSLLNSYQKVSHEDLKDKRKVEYIVDLSDPIKDNISTFLFYTTTSDYRMLVNNHYRNPNFRFLYFRLANILNNLKSGRPDPVSFDELVVILGYKGKVGRALNQQIEESIRKLLTLESLKGLHFEWKPSKNGYLYVPHFELSASHENNTLTESRHDKFKRLDLLILSRLRKIIDVPGNGKLSYLDIRFVLQKDPRVWEIFNQCYSSVMKREAKTEQLGLFLEHFVYRDDYGRPYASNLVRHVMVNGAPLVQDTLYQTSRLTIL